MKLKRPFPSSAFGTGIPRHIIFYAAYLHIFFLSSNSCLHWMRGHNKSQHKHTTILVKLQFVFVEFYSWRVSFKGCDRFEPNITWVTVRESRMVCDIRFVRHLSWFKWTGFCSFDIPFRYLQYFLYFVVTFNSTFSSISLENLSSLIQKLILFVTSILLSVTQTNLVAFFLLNTTNVATMASKDT